MSFARNSTVPPERSRVEIESTLRRYGADQFGTMEDQAHGKVSVGFTIGHLRIRVDAPMPKSDSEEFTTTDTGRERSESAAYKSYEQAIRSRWRSLLLAIKAKLEACECGISTIDVEFMPFVVMPDGKTLSEHMLPVLAQMADSGKMPKLLTANAG